MPSCFSSPGDSLTEYVRVHHDGIVSVTEHLTVPEADTESLGRGGPLLYASAIVAFGLQQLLALSAIGVPAPGPPWDTASVPLGVTTGTFLVGAGLAMMLRWHVVWAARVVATVVFLRALVYLTGIVRNSRDPGNWTSGFELLAIGGASLGLIALTTRTRRENTVARILFGGSLLVFGAQHFLYASFIAGLIPSWIPAREFWAHAVGACFCAAAIAILSGTLGQLAATLLALMFSTWVVILHLPRVISASADGREWTSLFVAVAMAGGSLIMRSLLSRSHDAPSREVAE